MFRCFYPIFRFLSPARTKQTMKHPKTMAVPVAITDHHLQLCKELFEQFDEAEAEVINDITNPEVAWQLLSKIRQYRRESQLEFARLLPDCPAASVNNDNSVTHALRTLQTASGINLTVFNGGRSR